MPAGPSGAALGARRVFVDERVQARRKALEGRRASGQPTRPESMPAGPSGAALGARRVFVDERVQARRKALEGRRASGQANKA